MIDQDKLNRVKTALRQVIELSEKKPTTDFTAPVGEGCQLGDTMLFLDTTYEEWREDMNFISTSCNLSPAMARALLGAIEDLEAIHEVSPMGEYGAWDALEKISNEFDL
jgi:hypothetical protein